MQSSTGGNWRRGDIVTLAEIAVRRALHGKPEPPPEPRRKRAKAYKVVH